MLMPLTYIVDYTIYTPFKIIWPQTERTVILNYGLCQNALRTETETLIIVVSFYVSWFYHCFLLLDHDCLKITLVTMRSVLLMSSTEESLKSVQWLMI